MDIPQDYSSILQWDRTIWCLAHLELECNGFFHLCLYNMKPNRYTIPPCPHLRRWSLSRGCTHAILWSYMAYIMHNYVRHNTLDSYALSSTLFSYYPLQELSACWGARLLCSTVISQLGTTWVMVVSVWLPMLCAMCRRSALACGRCNPGHSWGLSDTIHCFHSRLVSRLSACFTENETIDLGNLRTKKRCAHTLIMPTQPCRVAATSSGQDILLIVLRVVGEYPSLKHIFEMGSSGHTIADISDKRERQVLIESQS